MHKLRSFAVAAVALLGVAACSLDDDNSTGPAATASVRVAHLSPDAPNVDVLVDGAVVLSNVPYLAVSPFLTVPAGTRAVAVRPTGGAANVIAANLDLLPSGAYTVLATGNVADIAPVVAEDDLSAPAAGSARLRVVHAAPTVANVDVYATAPGADITTASPVLTNVPFRAVSAYLTVPAGTYQLRVTPTGTKTVAIDATATVTAGQIRTVVAREAVGGGAPFALQVLADN